VEGVFVALADGGLDTPVTPQALERMEAVDGHDIFRPDLRVCGDDLGEALRPGISV